ncbi:MAG: cation:proton antiporter [Actinobacteria bacterium]|nr:cation:proton antiporter [Actinomycetota bacterium]
MNELSAFAEMILVVAVGFSLALFGRSAIERLAIPSAALFLVAAAVAAALFPGLGEAISFVTVERIAVVALIVILFDGGMHIGWRRFRGSLVPILSLGVLGTFATAGLVAVAAHVLLDFSWITSGLLGAALAPTDPAVTFSVLAGREIRGRTGTILQGESGANDPAGIALMIGMIELATSDDGTFWTVVEEFAIEMIGGAVVGIAGAAALLPLMRRVSLPEPTLYPLRVLAAAGVIYGVATAVHGSGFLAVFVAGILIGDAAAPRKGEIEGFLGSLSSLAEIVVLAALGLTVELGSIVENDVWSDGVLLAALLGFVIRPLVVGVLLTPVRLDWGERGFVMWSGLKGAVPILLAALALIGGVEDGRTIYGIVFVVVLFSVVVQGTFLPAVATRLRVPMRQLEHGSTALRPFRVGAGAFADGRMIRDLPLAERAWVSAVVRDGRPHMVSGGTILAGGDEVHVLCREADAPALQRILGGR